MDNIRYSLYDKTVQDNEVYFEDLEIGTVFEHYGGIYVKTEPVRVDFIEVNALYLGNGKIYKFRYDDKVYVVRQLNVIQ